MRCSRQTATFLPSAVGGRRLSRKAIVAFLNEGFAPVLPFALLNVKGELG